MRLLPIALIATILAPLRVVSQMPAPQSGSAPTCMAGMAMPGCRVSDVRPTLGPVKTEDVRLEVPNLLVDAGKRKPMTLDTFISLASVANPTLAQANTAVHRSEQQARQAGLYPNPQVGYQGEQIRGGSYGGGEQGGYIEQKIVLGGKLDLRRDAYKQQKASDQIGLLEQQSGIREGVIEAFYSALAQQTSILVRKQLLGLALDAVATVHQLANVGQADASDILQAEVEAEQAKIDYVTAQRGYLKSFQVLATYAGQMDLPATLLEGTLDDPPKIDVEKLVAAILVESPSVKRAEQEVLVAEARLRSATREAVPDLTLRAGEQYNGERVAENPNKPVGAQSFASIGISLPLWNRNQGNIEAAKIDVERSRLEVVRTRLALKAAAEPLAQSYLSSQFEAQRYQAELIPRARKAYELYLTKYQQMASAYPQVLVSQRTLFHLQIAYIQALREVWTNAIALQNFTLAGALVSPVSNGGVNPPERATKASMTPHM